MFTNTIDALKLHFDVRYDNNIFNNNDSKNQSI